MSSVFRRPPDAERNIDASLYFGNLDPEVTELIMYELFIQFAPLRYLNMPKDRILKTHQGYGFVEFRTVRDADYALDILRGVRLYGKQLKIKKAEPPKSGTSSESQFVGATGGAINVGAKLFLNNLSPLVDEQFLRETFSKFGTLIKNPVVARDPETGESRGYGFLTFDDFTVCDEVIAKMDGALLMNGKISVSYAFKDDKKARHGDKVERLLAEAAKENRVSVKATKRDSTSKKKVGKPGKRDRAR
ncbi:predicted protein [Scheffersomyces stipitis CBS 6054]|uniref:RRM domain-containing protein n=1 Tax=Scheffersomyces stipitis (strain ATCC 58785 / CBS 6054 / NBRC 10063 / NRRL Y-11545) TaxID=322104 RepID=A3LYC2_PICST|nr:predicted protein [Scheffersomyces stipitis CBS 6054]ABN67606.2 predicted protein [Scheffersomyces stipitis CBS 6054]